MLMTDLLGAHTLLCLAKRNEVQKATEKKRKKERSYNRHACLTETLTDTVNSCRYNRHVTHPNSINLINSLGCERSLSLNFTPFI
jgi:hypothetical protein